MGDLLIQTQQQLFPQQLAHDLPFRLVGGLSVREQLRTFLGVFLQFMHQIVQTAALMGRNGNDGVKSVPHLVVSRNHRQQLRRLHSVDLVDAQDAGDLFLPDAVDQRLLRSSHMGDGLHQQQRAVHIAEAGGHDLYHVIPQSGLGLVQSRRIQQNVLGVLPIHNAVDPVPGCLGLVGNDGDLFAHQRVGQAGLAHVGPSANGDHGGFCNV